MASKHSKNFFDFRKSVYSSPPINKQGVVDALSLPFKIIIAVLVVSLALSSVLVGSFFMQGNPHKTLLADAKSIFNSMDSGLALKTLAQENPDIKGWIKIDGANIDYAVCQGEDDDFYINHNQLGKKSRYGALFLPSDDSFQRKGNDKNIVIFGNNMKDGSMFGSLKKYRNLNFYKQNPCINLYYGDKAETYVVFAVMLVSSLNDDGGDIYKPSKSHFANDNEFNLWRNETLSRSLINTTVEVKHGDNMLTLVTVANDFDGARLVIMAKQTDEWNASHTDVSEASVNPKIKYPKIWYTTRGLEYPY